jgi:hypothetical protein
MASAPFVLLRAGARLLVGHVAVGNGVAGLVQRRGDDPLLSYTAAVLGAADEAVHGGNASGLVCASLEVGGHPLVGALLAAAHGVDEAVEWARSEEPGRSGRLLLADAGAAVVVTVGGELGEVLAEEADGGGLAALIARLRAAEPPPREGAIPAAGLAAVLAPDEPPRLHIALGPPCCAVFIRYWPGMEVTPEVSASPEGSTLARLAAAVAQTTATDADLRGAARERLDAAEAEALAEGEAAEHMAALMDGHTDDRGAAVRRLVAQSYAAERAREALEELAVPAPGGGPPRRASARG